MGTARSPGGHKEWLKILFIQVILVFKRLAVFFYILGGIHSKNFIKILSEEKNWKFSKLTGD